MALIQIVNEAKRRYLIKVSKAESNEATPGENLGILSQRIYMKSMQPHLALNEHRNDVNKHFMNDKSRFNGIQRCISTIIWVTEWTTEYKI